MLTPAKLFWIRLKQHYRYMGKSLHTIADWTVWLYIIVPALFIFSGLYIELWTKLPEWSYVMRWELIIVAVSSMMLYFQVHIGVEEADRLVLLQHRDWHMKLKRYGYAYSVILLLVRLLLVMGLLLPFIKGTTDLSNEQLLLLLGYSVIAGMTMLTINHYFNKSGAWWRKMLRTMQRTFIVGIIYVLPAALYMLGFLTMPYMLVATGVLFFVLIVLIYHFMTKSFNYGQQLEQEQEKRARFTGMLLSQVEEQTQSTKRLKKPWIFRSSQRLFKSTDQRFVVTELRIKAMLRSKQLLQAWIILIAVGSYAIFLVGGSGGWAVVVGIYYLQRFALKLQWDEWVKRDYLSLYIKEQLAGYKLSQNILSIPALIIWIVIAILCSI